MSVLLRVLLPVAAAAAPRRMNVLLVAVDDLRPQLGSYGHPAMLTPNIDKLADSSMVFEHGYTNYPYCCPSRNRWRPVSRRCPPLHSACEPDARRR
jgi:hypothetical protein